MADITQRGLNNIDNRSKSEGPFNDIPMISESDLPRKFIWECRVKNAVKDEPDKFREEVCILTVRHATVLHVYVYR